jgi:RNA polymerase sigma-70 factor (ECF subfamily)
MAHPHPPLTLVSPPPAEMAAPFTLDEVFRTCSAYVAYIGVRILGQDEDVDDLVQDVFIEALRGMSGLKDAGAVRGWLGTVTVRVASRRLKVRRLRRFLRLEDAPDYEARAWAGAGQEQCAALARVYRLLDQVPARHRIAWILRVVEGLEVDEVAGRCEVSRATVKRWIEAVQARIERRLGDG